jgi:hypothetical protein
MFIRRVVVSLIRHSFVIPVKLAIFSQSRNESEALSSPEWQDGRLVTDYGFYIATLPLSYKKWPERHRDGFAASKLRYVRSFAHCKHKVFKLWAVLYCKITNTPILNYIIDWKRALICNLKWHVDCQISFNGNIWLDAHLGFKLVVGAHSRDYQ